MAELTMNVRESLQVAINFHHDPHGDPDRETVLGFVICQHEMFRADFCYWLEENYPIWQEFQRRAMAIWKSGRKHFGHRTIWESIRFETALHESGSDYKLNNDYTKSCAVLFTLLNPECSGLFEFRERN